MLSVFLSQSFRNKRLALFLFPKKFTRMLSVFLSQSFRNKRLALFLFPKKFTRSERSDIYRKPV